jgi:predicted ester cyclase
MSTTSKTTTSETSALAVVRRLLDEGFATGDASVVDELCSPDLVEHQFGLAGRGEAARDNIRQAIRDVHGMSPDLTYTIEDSAQAGDTVWVRATGRGTATGSFFGPPSGRPIELTVIDVARVVDGQVVEHWGVPDRFALLAQTGALARLH